MASNGQHHDETALVAVPPAPLNALALQMAPDFVLAEAARAAAALRDVIEKKPNKCVIRGKTFPQFEDWQTLGRFYGVTAKTRSTKFVEFGEGYDRVRGFEATADALLVSTNQVISSAEAMCLDDEEKWSDAPLFQVKSMAQTRACAKALRNVLAWVVVLAGYNPTPAEELEGDIEEQVSSPRRKSERKRKGKGSVEVIHASGETISFVQTKELFELGHQHGLNPEQVMKIIAKTGYKQPGEVPASLLADIQATIRKGVQ